MNLGGLQTFSGEQTGVAPGVAVNHPAFVPFRVRFSARPRHVEPNKHSGLLQSAERQILNLEMGVRLSQPELRPTAAQVNRRFPELTLTVERQRHGADGVMTTEYGNLRSVPTLRDATLA